MNTTTAAAPTFLDHHQLQFLATHSPIYYTPHESVISGIPDHVLALAAPVIIYWVLSAWFHVLDTAGWKWPAKYRIHESAEVMSKNLATRGQVLREVILQQLIQTGMGLVWMEQAPAGAAVDHVAAMLRLAGPMASVVNWVLGPELGGQLLATRGAVGLYTLYWWAIPLGQLLVGMCALLFPLLLRRSRLTLRASAAS